MPDAANFPESGNGAADPAGPKLGRGEALAPAVDRRSGGRMPVALRGWVQENFARDRLVASFKTLLWVAPLTLLIWIYAEREQQFTPPPVTIPIEITTNDPNRLVSLKRPDANRPDPNKPDELLVMATVTGPRSGVEAVIHSLDPGYGGPVRVEIDRNLLGVGERRIDLAVIGKDPRFASHGVTVLSCQPAYLDVLVDQIVEKAVEVKPVNVPSSVGSVTFVPPTIKMRGPEKVLDEALAAGRLYATANLAQQPELANLVLSGSDHPIALSDVKVTLPIEDRNVSIVGSPFVQAEASLNAGKPLMLDKVQVELVSTNDVLDHYKVVYDRTLLNVTVVGPEDRIDLLTRTDSSRFTPKASFEVGLDDISSAGPDGKTVLVDFKLPSNVKYSSGPREITFHLVERRNGE